MRFPLGDWIDAHEGVRHHLGSSGMRGTVRHPLPSRADVRSATERELRDRLADLLGVSPARLFLTHGATEANSLTIEHLARRAGSRRPRARVARPEYPPLVDAVRDAGFRVAETLGPVELALVSQPHNPVGDRWDADRLLDWSEGARHTIVDETFREFSPVPSVQRLAIPRLWTTGSFTKVYGADDLRVGYVVAPEPERERFARFHGLVADELPPYSVAGALVTLAARDRILREVRGIVGRNQALWQSAIPGGPPLAAPVAFDDPVPFGGDRFARRCLRASVLVCPGSFFGRASGVRVGLTRRSFPSDLKAYLRVRDAST